MDITSIMKKRRRKNIFASKMPKNKFKISIQVDHVTKQRVRALKKQTKFIKQ